MLSLAALAVGAAAATLVAAAAALAANFTAWAVIALVWIHGCGHSGLVGQCQVVLNRIALMAFTAWLATRFWACVAARLVAAISTLTSAALAPAQLLPRLARRTDFVGVVAR